MKILLITGPLFPQPGNNANLIAKLIPDLQAEHEVHLAAMTSGEGILPEVLFSVPVHWLKDAGSGFERRLVMPLRAKLEDPHGYSDSLMEQITRKELEKLRKEYPFDAVIATCEPFFSALAAARMKNCKKILYMMDPPSKLCGETGTVFRNRMLGKLLEKYDSILTTPFIREALKEHDFGKYDGKIVSVGFPMIEVHTHGDTHIIDTNGGKINLLFCGWLYSDIRSPRYFLEIVSKLDEHFCVTFMGRECDKLHERFAFETKAEIVTLPQQPYLAAVDAMLDADVLINIGNSVPVHMPSKTLEYINTGKPVVNFYKLKECPTKYYTGRYPLCLNLYEKDGDIEKAAEVFISFCLSAKGKAVERGETEREFADCTPQYIARKLLEILGEQE